MRRILSVLFLILCIFTGCMAAPPRSEAVAAAQWPVAFVIPHQDDELLSMGAAIRAHVLAGRPVYLFLVTDGSATGACLAQPPAGFGLTAEQCTTERDLEFRLSAAHLGVPPENVQIVYNLETGQRFKDGTINATNAGLAWNWIWSFLRRKYPAPAPISLKSMSWTDNHLDHANLGAVLRSRCVNYGGDCRFYLKDSYPTQPIPSGAVTYTETTTDVAAVRAANYDYRPPQTMGIGYKSMGSWFDYAYTNANRSRAHKWVSPTTTVTTVAKRVIKR